MLNENGTTSQRCHQLDVAVVQKVVILASETGVGLLLDFEDNVTSKNAGGLITLATELDASAALNASVNVDVENLSVDNRLLSVALLAAVLLFDDLSLTVTVRAGGLEALNHGAHLSHHSLHTVTIAARAALDSAFLASATLALGADDGALQGQLGNLSAVNVFEGNLVGVVNGASLGRAAGLAAAAAKHASETAQAAAAEELCEQILSSHATTAAAALQTGLACLVVDTSLLCIGEDFVGMGDFLEFVLGLLVAGVLVCRNVRWC